MHKVNWKRQTSKSLEPIKSPSQLTLNPQGTYHFKTIFGQAVSKSAKKLLTQEASSWLMEGSWIVTTKMCKSLKTIQKIMIITLLTYCSTKTPNPVKLIPIPVLTITRMRHLSRITQLTATSNSRITKASAWFNPCKLWMHWILIPSSHSLLRNKVNRGDRKVKW